MKQKKAFPFLATDANEANAMFSPDGKWVAYNSDESGQPEIYVQPFLAKKGGKWQVSTNGGYTPKWSKDGKELFYLSLDNQIMSSEVKLGSTGFAVHSALTSSPPNITVILNWPLLLNPKK